MLRVDMFRIEADSKEPDLQCPKSLARGALERQIASLFDSLDLVLRMDNFKLPNGGYLAGLCLPYFDALRNAHRVHFA